MKIKIPTSRKIFVWVAYLALVISGVAMVFAPVWIIQPFRPQVSSDLSLSFQLRKWSPLVTLLASMVATGLLVYLWMASRRWFGKVALILIILPLIVCTWFTRHNYFEWAFNGLHNPAYAKVSDASFLGDDDRVMAVNLNNESAAYPIRQLAYHHVAQDVVGGVPIVVTY